MHRSENQEGMSGDDESIMAAMENTKKHKSNAPKDAESYTKKMKMTESTCSQSPTMQSKIHDRNIDDVIHCEGCVIVLLDSCLNVNDMSIKLKQKFMSQQRNKKKWLETEK